MRRRGLTMVEVLVCIAIAAVLCAILLPVVAEAKSSAQRSTTVSNFRQIYAGLALYRSEYGGDGVYGVASKMGLPPGLKDLAVAERLPKAIFRSGCPSVRAPVLKLPLFRMMWHEDGDPTAQDWAPYAQKSQGSTVLLGDDNCDFLDRALDNPMVSHRAIGLYEAGNVRTVVKMGSNLPYEWWN